MIYKHNLFVGMFGILLPLLEGLLLMALIAGDPGAIDRRSTY